VGRDGFEEVCKYGLEREEERKNKQPEPAMDIAVRDCKNPRGTIPQLSNTTLMVVIHRVPNSNNDQTFSNYRQASYTDVRHWEELVDFIKKIVARNHHTV
jgi:hypothetical protein